MEFVHVSVLKEESIEGLNIKKNGIYVDGTTGAGGHSKEIAKKLTTGKLFCIDRDKEALAVAKENLKEFKNVVFCHGNYCDVKNILKEKGVEKIDGMLLDIGVSSYQLDNAERGFSYTKNSPLDMRMDSSQTKDAKEVVNSYSFEELVKIFYEYGEEEFSKPIAKQIVKMRQIKEIETTFELCEIINSCIPKKVQVQRGNACKKVFQAIRIEVNGELDALKQGIKDAFEILNKGGRLSVITFHSLEDRIVKKTFNEFCEGCTCREYSPICICGKTPRAKLINKKPILPSELEILQNKRSKSAKLRVLEKIV